LLLVRQQRSASALREGQRRGGRNETGRRDRAAYLPDTPEIRSDILDYSRCNALTATGEVLRALEESGKAENTLVVITGDNGWPFLAAKLTFTTPERGKIHSPSAGRQSSVAKTMMRS
jgi:hypothetical protein